VREIPKKNRKRTSRSGLTSPRTATRHELLIVTSGYREAEEKSNLWVAIQQEMKGQGSQTRSWVAQPWISNRPPR
jgi:hypothetical protein